MSNSDRKQCVRCNATEGEYQPDYGWHLCGTCYEEKKREEYEEMPDVVVVYEYKSGRKWMTKDEWDAKSVRHSPNVVGKATYKKVEEA